jgi:hypothetical protein
VRARCTLSRIDYEDAFLIETADARERTAEQWARAQSEDAPASIRRALRRGWWALGLKLAPSGSERFVLGWEVRRSTPEYLLLGARSRIGMPAQLLLQRRERALLLSTFMQQRNPIARVLWSRVEPMHQRVAPSVIARGVGRLGRPARP